MIALDNTKCSFVFCLVICILICSTLYLKAQTPNAPLALPTSQPTTPQLLPIQNTPTCPILPATPHGLIWRRNECKTVTHLTDPSLNCSQLLRDVRFITEPLSKEEEDFPLAFIITIHKELDTFMRLLRAIYMPQNVYCIHIDDKSPEQYKSSVQKLIRCFPNVFLASKSEKVTYAGFSRLQADINCMKDLVKSRSQWRRVINLCGQDFPIQTNLELVRYMNTKEWKDKNMTPGVKQPDAMKIRTRFRYHEVGHAYVERKGSEKKMAAPHNLTVFFGTAYYSLIRPFVEFVLANRLATDLLEWSKDTFSPDEHYWVTLNHVEEAPGSNVNSGWNGNVRAIKWSDQEGTTHEGCKGKYVRDICIFGMEDLPWVINKGSMFANKFEIASFPEALDCMELWHRHKVLQQATVPILPSWTLSTAVDHSNSTSFTSIVDCF